MGLLEVWLWIEFDAFVVRDAVAIWFAEIDSLAEPVIVIINWYPEAVVVPPAIHYKISLADSVRNVDFLVDPIDKIVAWHEIDDYTIENRNLCFLIDLVAVDLLFSC